MISQLRQIQIDITNKCNLSCKHCRADANTNNDYITRDVFCDIVDVFVDQGGQRITISGGEPFLHPDIFEFIDYLCGQSKLKYIGITSNGMLLNSYVLDKLEKYKSLINIQISIDGFENEHDANRSQKGVYEIVIKNIKEMVLRNFCVSTNTTINNKNIDNFNELVDFLISIGLKNIGFRHEIPCGRSKIQQDYNFNKKYILLLVKYFCRFEDDYPSVKFSSGDPIRLLVDSNVFSDFDLQKIKSSKVIGGCSIGIAILYINSSGDIFPCAYLDKKIGNLYKDYIYDIWEDSKFLQRIRSKNDLSGKCKNCEWRFICGGCRASTSDKRVLGEDIFCLFGLSQCDSFMSYLKRRDLDKYIEDISLAPKNGYQFFPYWCQMALDITSNDVSNIIKSSWAKRDIKEIQKKGYTYNVSNKREDLIYFYKNLYLPSSLKHYNDEEILLSPFFFIEHMFKKNGYVLFVKDNKGKIIGGCLLSQIRKGEYVSPVMGISVNFQEKNNFISSSLYFFMLDWACKNKIKRLFYGKTRLIKNDTVFDFKKKWGATQITPEKSGVYLKINKKYVDEVMLIL